MCSTSVFYIKESPTVFCRSAAPCPESIGEVVERERMVGEVALSGRRVDVLKSAKSRKKEVASRRESH